VRADGAIDVTGGRHVNGAIDLGGAGGGGLLCASCHGYPPATGAHLVHFGWTAGADRATYGETAILEDYAALGAPTGSFYAFGCGNCHPVDPARHMDGALQVELAGTGLPPETLKSRNPPEAAFSRPAGTCASVYCHSSGQQASAAAGTPVYATTPGWGSGEKLGCGSCHGNPPRYPSGGPGAVTANSHIGLAFDGYSFGHFGGLPGIWHPGPTFGSKHGGGNFPASPPEGASPITCQTCHHATVDPANAGPSGFYYLDTSGDYSVPGAVNHYDCLACHVAGSPVAPTGAGRVLPLRHVNGSRDVAFDPRTALPSISWLPVAPFTPTRPTWVTDAAPLVTALPAGAVFDPAALPSPSPGPYTKPTLSLSLSNAGWAPGLKTCSNVGCHLAQAAVQWGGVPLNARDPCAACHGL
jgi:predicted CxxxxCH...CXXCH cytochrome family protein